MGQDCSRETEDSKHLQAAFIGVFKRIKDSAQNLNNNFEHECLENNFHSEIASKFHKQLQRNSTWTH